MAREKDLERLSDLTGEKDEDLLELLLDDAQEFVLAYTNRTKMKDALYKPVRDLALIAYNRRGTEGEASRSEGGESYSFDNAPAQVYNILDRWRLARAGGHAHEA